MSNTENPLSLDPDDIRAKLGSLRFDHTGGTTVARRGSGTVVEFSNWVNTQTGAPLHKVFSSEHTTELPEPDEVRSVIIERLRALKESGLNREKLAQWLTPVGARLTDQTPISYLVLPTKTTVEEEEGGWTESRIPPVNRDFDFSGVHKGYIHSYQMAMKDLLGADPPLTVGEVRNLSVTALRNRGPKIGQEKTIARIRAGSVKFAKAFLNKAK